MNTPHENLASAIVVLAAKDYKRTLQRLRDTPHPGKRTGKSKKMRYAQLLAQKAEILSFFHSDWYRTLTDVDPERIINQIECEVI